MTKTAKKVTMVQPGPAHPTSSLRVSPSNGQVHSNTRSKRMLPGQARTQPKIRITVIHLQQCLIRTVEVKNMIHQRKLSRKDKKTLEINNLQILMKFLFHKSNPELLKNCLRAISKMQDPMLFHHHQIEIHLRNKADLNKKENFYVGKHRHQLQLPHHS